MPEAKKLAALRLMNMTFYGYHGTSAAEKETGRRFEVDCELEVDVAEAVKTDSLDKTVNYTHVYRIVEDILHNHRYNLVETLAERIAEAILKNFNVKSVILRVRKRNPPVPGNIDYLEAEIRRSREDA